MWIALTREVSPAFDQCELTHLERQPIDVRLAQTQHHAYENCLSQLGCAVYRLPAEPDLPDSVFVEDTAVVVEELAIITRPGAESRRLETASMAKTLSPYRKPVRIQAPGTLDGGDVLRVGRTIYVGSSSRSNPAALEQMRGVAEAAVRAVGLVDAGFAVEMRAGKDGVQVIEVNGRLASQFAPLVQALHGRSTYDALFELACGHDPRWRTGRPDGVGVSYCLRVFEDAFVDGAPDPEEGLELLVRPGLHLSEQGVNDAQSYRLCILYGVGETREEAVRICRERARALSFRLAPARVR